MNPARRWPGRHTPLCVHARTAEQHAKDSRAGGAADLQPGESTAAGPGRHTPAAELAASVHARTAVQHAEDGRPGGAADLQARIGTVAGVESNGTRAGKAAGGALSKDVPSPRSGAQLNPELPWGEGVEARHRGPWTRHRGPSTIDLRLGLDH
jgi:hypothetical protein